MRYTVVSIDEDIDFGCEERALGAPVMALVTLEDENGQRSTIRQEDQLLYDRDINENDTVIINEERKLQKGGHTVIGCDACDMRIELDEK